MEEGEQVFSSMMFNKDLINKPITGENLEKEVAYFEPEFIQKRCRSSMNGTWKFIFCDEFDEFYLNENFDISDLDTIKVPSHIELNGYDKPKYCNVMYPWEGRENLKLGEVPKNNKIGVYFKDLDIELEDKDYFIEFEGFESALYLYVNGSYVGFSTKNYTTSTFKLNNYLKNGKNRIVVVVYKYSFISWLSDQDMWRFFGIHRDVNLVTRNKFHIVDFKNSAVLQDNLIDGSIKLDIEFSDFDHHLKLEYSLKYGDKVIRKRIYDVKSKNLTIDFDVPECYPWSDEKPNLYTTELVLRHDFLECEEVRFSFGFKKIEIKDGTILLNGQRLIIKGVNRHEFDSRYGRAIPISSIEEDLINIKKHNINAIRTSHYPNTNYFYKRCTELGILVMDETAIETHGTWMHLNLKENQELNVLPGSFNNYRDVTVERGMAMYERDKNHTCVFSWSLGNESYAGKNLEALYREFKEKDSTRFVHYEGCSQIKEYSHISDVHSRMYEKPGSIRNYLIKHPYTPYLLCEFSHSMGNSTGNFDEYMKLAEDFKNYNGGFIWDYIDQGLLIDGKYYFGGDFREFPNDGNFCADGLLLANKENTSKIEAVKYYYQPLSFNITKNKIEVTSKYKHIDTSHLNFVVKLFKDEESIWEKEFKMTVFPDETVPFVFDNKVKFEKNRRYMIRISVFNESGEEIAFEEKFIKGPIDNVNYEINKRSTNELEVYKSHNHITVQNSNIQVIFNGVGINNGGLEAIYVDGKNYLNNIVFPTLFRATIDNEAILGKYLNSFYLGASKYPLYNPFYKGGIKVVSKDSKKVAVEVRYNMIAGLSFNTFKIKYTIYNSGEIKVNFSYKTPLFLPKPPLVGIKFKFDKEFDNFSYVGMGPGDNYCDRYKGQKYGRYFSKASKEYVNYSTPQECGNHEFTKEVHIKIGNKFMSFIALNKTFSFKYLPYNEFEMENAERFEDLPYSKFNYLTIHAANKGVGGDDSWGAPVHKKYRLKHKKYEQKFIIKIR